MQFLGRLGTQTNIGVDRYNQTRPFVSQTFLYERLSSYSTPNSLCISCNDYNTVYKVDPVPAMNVCGEWSTAPYICSTRHEMEVISQLRATAAQRGSGTEDPVGTVWRRGKPLALVGNRTTISRSPSLKQNYSTGCNSTGE
jgi:hypothetical protein